MKLRLTEHYNCSSGPYHKVIYEYCYLYEVMYVSMCILIFGNICESPRNCFYETRTGHGIGGYLPISDMGNLLKLSGHILTLLGLLRQTIGLTRW